MDLLCIVYILCQLMSTLDCCHIKLKPNMTYDFIVVGGGSAGATLAKRLSEDPKVKVLLLEAGYTPPFLSGIPAYAPYLVGSEIDWRYMMETDNASFLSYEGNKVRYPRGKVLGGCSGINVMIYIRGNKHDYDNWASLGNKGWDWNSVLPYFLKSEGDTVPWTRNDSIYHYTKGPLTISQAPFHTESLKAFLESGVENNYTVLDCNGPSQTGFMPISFTMRNGARCSTYTAYLSNTLSIKNLQIATQTTVIKVIFQGTQAIGVLAYQDGKEVFVKASKEVILSAGAIGSPTILLQSGVGPAAELEKLKIPVVADLPGVGQNLQDHIGCAAAIWSVDCKDCTYDSKEAMSFVSITKWLFARRGPETIPYGSESVAFVNTKYADKNGEWPDIELHYLSTTDTHFFQKVFGFGEETDKKFFGTLDGKNTFSVIPFLLHPKSRGYLKLKSNNPVDPPIFNFKYFENEEDMRVLVEGMKIAYNVGQSSPFKAFGAKFNEAPVPGCENYTMFSDGYWECACRHLTIIFFHAAGSCKMGPSTDNMAVVDSNLKVYKVKGLRVADASIMPVIISGNTNAPTIMVAEKLAHEIKEEYGFNVNTTDNFNSMIDSLVAAIDNVICEILPN